VSSPSVCHNNITYDNRSSVNALTLLAPGPGQRAAVDSHSFSERLVLSLGKHRADETLSPTAGMSQLEGAGGLRARQRVPPSSAATRDRPLTKANRRQRRELPHGDESNSTSSTSSRSQASKAVDMPTLAANITTYGPQLETYIGTTKHHILLITETHLSKERLPEIIRKLRSTGWEVTASIADPTGRSAEGTSGGTMCMVRSHIATNDLGAVERTRGADWSLMPLRLKGLDLDLYSLYLTDGLGNSGENVDKLAQLSESVAYRGNEYIIMGDFNMPPEQLADSGWLDVVKGHLFSSSQCHLGVQERLQGPGLWHCIARRPCQPPWTRH